MRILVLLEVGADVRVPPELDPRSGRVRREWLVREPDPASARALELGLALQSPVAADVTVVHLGPAGSERYLRGALARGARGAIRVWSDELDGAGAPGKALVLAEAARAAGFDLVLAGSVGVVGASGQVGVLLAERLGVPCITQVQDLAIAMDDAGAAWAEITRALDRGFRERVAAPLPLVVTVSAGPAGAEAAPPQASAWARLRAEAAEIPVWDLADLGVPLAQLRARRTLHAGPPLPARPRLHTIAAPDSSLPAFDRILKLVEGSVKRREGRVVRQAPEETVEEIFAALRAEGWLDHLRPGSAGEAGAPDAATP